MMFKFFLFTDISDSSIQCMMFPSQKWQVSLVTDLYNQRHLCFIFYRYSFYLIFLSFTLNNFIKLSLALKNIHFPQYGLSKKRIQAIFHPLSCSQTSVYPIATEILPFWRPSPQS